MYFKGITEDELIIKTQKGYMDILSGQKIIHKDLNIYKIEDEEFNNLLEILKEKNLLYFVKGFNNQNICTKNTRYVFRKIGGVKTSSSSIGRCTDIPKKLFEDIYGMIYKIGTYTIRDIKTFVYFIKEALQSNCILLEKDIPPRKYYEKKGGQNPRVIMEKKIFISLSQEILRLMESFENDDQDKLSSILERYNIDEILEMYELYNSQPEEFDIKISGIIQENKYNLLTFFSRK